MKRPNFALRVTPRNAAFGFVVAALFATTPARAEDLLQIYREAQLNDPTLAAARASWDATQELAPQARAGLLPTLSAAASANANNFSEKIRSDPPQEINNRNFGIGQLSVSASQPLYRVQNKVAYDQAKQQVAQADYTLSSAQQDLILRVAVAYFDVLLAEFNVELADSQKAAVSEQLAQAKRNFEVGVATITDTNEAQAKYDSIVAQEISARNDLDNKRTALRAIIGRAPPPLKRVGRGFDPALPNPNSADYWVDKALAENLAVKIAAYNVDIATLEIDRQKAGHLPTLDLVGSYQYQGGSGATNFSSGFDFRQGQIGVQLNVPIYQGGFVDSKVRQAIALQDNARQNLEVARRAALFNAQTGFAGVNSAAASVKAFEQAAASAQVAYESNRLGQEVGVRTNLDVLNTQQNVYQARRDVAQAYFNYLIGVLRLRAAVGTLTEQDLEEINRRLTG
ncbi:MAG TPA: TolC family outer membrane protein [Casimicrobiaceae bacterium]|nr:TolC family outer membrane protein [Casimicrobiaceae bacterium]